MSSFTITTPKQALTPSSTDAIQPMRLANIKPQRQEIQRGVFLYTYRSIEKTTRFHYEVECVKYQRLEITIQFHGSENMELEEFATLADGGEGPLQKTVRVEPFQRVTIGTLRLIDPYATAQLKVAYKLRVYKAEVTQMTPSMQCDRDDIATALAGSKYAQLNQRPTLRDMNMACVEHQVNFVDVDFPPMDSSLVGRAASSVAIGGGGSGSGSGGGGGSGSGSGSSGVENDDGIHESAESLVDLISHASMNDIPENTIFEDTFLSRLIKLHGGITWRRPLDFMSKEHDLFRRANGGVGGGPPMVSPTDVREGELCDHWLMSALSVLAERPYLIHRLFQSKNERNYPEMLNSHGAYKVFLTKNGEKKEVLVDDYFPCSPTGGPIFARSSDDTLWVSIVEKAMAKIHGGYVYLKSSMKSKWTYQGLSDLTGAPTTNSEYLFLLTLIFFIFFILCVCVLTLFIIIFFCFFHFFL